MELSKFSHQHYVEIARVLQKHYPYINYGKLVFDFKRLFKSDNEHFKEELFTAACIPEVLKRKKEVK